MAAQAKAGPFSDIPASYWDAGRIEIAVRQGLIAPYGSGRFEPTWAFTQGEMATDLPRLGRPDLSAAVALSAVEAAVQAEGQTYSASATISHAEFADALVLAFGLSTAASAMAGLASPWPDAATIPAWARGASTLFGRLGLSWGDTWNGTFQATGGVARDQAAWALIGAEQVGASAEAQALSPIVHQVVLEGVPTTLTTGQKVPIHAVVEDASGASLPVPVLWSTTGALVLHAGVLQAGGTGSSGTVMARATDTEVEAQSQIAVTGATGQASTDPVTKTKGKDPSGRAASGTAGSATGTSAGPSGSGAGDASAKTTPTTPTGAQGHAAQTPKAKGPLWDVPTTIWDLSDIRDMASAGILPLSANGAFDPEGPLTQGALAGALARAFGVPQARAAVWIDTATGRKTLRAGAPVTHATLATALVLGLGLERVAEDESTDRVPWRDTSRLPWIAKGATTVFGQLGLSMGNLPRGFLDPTMRTERAQAAFAFAQALKLSHGAVAGEASRVVKRIAIGHPLHVTALTPVRFVARALDAHGRPVPAAVKWSATDGTIQSDGEFVASAPGTAHVVARAALSPVRAAARVTVQAPAPTALSLSLPESVVADTPAQISVRVEASAGTDRFDSGRTLTLSWTGPSGGGSSTAKDDHGVAVFAFDPPESGTYTLSVQGQGLNPVTAAVDVTDPPVTATALDVSAITPNSALEGASVTFEVEVLTGQGAVDVADAGRSVTLTVTPSSGGSPVTLTGSDAAGIATFTWTAGAPGPYQVAATSAGLASGAGTLTVTASPAAGIALSATSLVVAPGATIPIEATLVDSQGQPTVGAVPISVGLGALSVGSLANAATELQNTGAVATYTAPASVTGTGTAVVIVTSPGFPAATLTLTIASGSLADTVGFQVGPYAATAGQATDVVVALDAPGGAADTSSTGVDVTLTVGTPAGTDVTLTVPDQAGIATFPLTETLAGTYSLSAGAQGASGTAKTTLTVNPGPPSEIAITANPSSLLVPGQTATISAAVADAYGNPEAAGTSVPVTLTGSAGSVGTLTMVSSTAPGTIAQFTASEAGSVTLTAQSQGLKPATLTLTVQKSPATLVSGKGMWLMYQDWSDNPVQSLIATAQADHITHLYLEVATTDNGFYGQNALNSILGPAHAAHIAVIAWVYTALYSPAKDAAMTEQVANYTTPSGQRVDGIAADIEAVVTNAAVGAYANAVRTALPDELFVGVTYPPLYHMSYPYATLAKDVNVIDPMDYWHSMPQPYTESYVYQYVTNSIDTIRKLDGNPALPIAPIGQAYDMFTSSGTGPNNPTSQEITGGFDAAQADGAIGFSLYRWGTATKSEWKTWAALNWGAPQGSQG